MLAVLSTDQLSRTYRTYRKTDGLWNSIRGFWSRQYEEKKALDPEHVGEISEGVPPYDSDVTNKSLH